MSEISHFQMYSNTHFSSFWQFTPMISELGMWVETDHADMPDRHVPMMIHWHHQRKQGYMSFSCLCQKTDSLKPK